MARQYFLANPEHDESLLPVTAQTARRLAAGRALTTAIKSSQDSQIVIEFRNKLRLAEDLISKLAYSLGEIQGARRSGKSSKPARAATVLAKTFSFHRD